MKVDLAELAAKVDEYGFAYLITVNGEGRAHVLAVTPEMTPDGVLLGGIGRHTLANVADNPTATLIWPPADAAGYSLLVDGTVSADPGAATVTVAPTKAILHRPAPGADGKRVGNDCADLAENRL